MDKPDSTARTRRGTGKVAAGDIGELRRRLRHVAADIRGFAADFPDHAQRLVTLGDLLDREARRKFGTDGLAARDESE